MDADPILMLKLLVIISTVTSCLSGVLGVIQFFRRSPPLDAEVTRLEREVITNHPTKAEIRECAARCNESVHTQKDELERLRADVFSRINADRGSVQEAIREFEGRLGKLEGGQQHRGRS